MGRISMATRDELVGALVARYAGSNRKERGRILDEFVAVSGVHRKHAMRLLRAGQAHHRSGPRPAQRLYNEAVREALVVLWEASDRVCGKRLRALVPILDLALPKPRCSLRKVRCSPSSPCSRARARCAWLRVAPLLPILSAVPRGLGSARSARESRLADRTEKPACMTPAAEPSGESLEHQAVWRMTVSR